MMVPDLSIIEKISVLIGAIVGLWARLEIGQALNRQNIRGLWARRREDYQTLERKLDRAIDDTKDMRKELIDELRLVRQAIERTKQ